ncbi:MAG: hypothetical protein ACT4OI_07085 [Methanobacteriota archaeon]
MALGPGPGTAPASPPSVSPPPYAPTSPPTAPRSDGLTVVLVVVVAVLVVGALAGAVVLFGLLGDVFRNPTPRPTVAFTSADLTDGNATVPILLVTEAVPAENYRFLVQLNVTTGPTTAIPPPGAVAVVPVTGHVLRVSWVDADGDLLVSEGDAFRITGDTEPLPASTTFLFELRWSDGLVVGASAWATL